MVAIRRAFGKYAPDSLYAVGYSAFSHLFEKRGAVRIKKSDGCWKVTDKDTGESFFVPAPQFALRADNNGSFDFGHKKIDRYTNPGFVDVEVGDTVVEVGAFIGEFTLYAADIAEEVLALEPDPGSANCLRRNLNKFCNVEVIEAVAWREDDILKFAFGNDPTENSIFGVDAGGVERVKKVPTHRLDSLLSEHGLDTIDLLKIDAEGAEPEVLEGLGEYRPRKIAVDTSAEREGDSTTKAVTNWLQQRDYEVQTDDEMLFAYD